MHESKCVDLYKTWLDRCSVKKLKVRPALNVQILYCGILLNLTGLPSHGTADNISSFVI
jgi:hypothetical protein